MFDQLSVGLWRSPLDIGFFVMMNFFFFFFWGKYAVLDPLGRSNTFFVSASCQKLVVSLANVM